jgi:ubiquinone/menaquinone biosynthesis C-methylase UbiE
MVSCISGNPGCARYYHIKKTMQNNKLYSAEDITRTYEQVHDLLLTRYIIKTYSTNRADIRDIALRGLNLKKAKKVLELGCGYGFFIEKLKGMLHEKATIIGVDLVETNREPFLHSVASIQYKGEFITGSADIIREMPESLFDLIIASYSLYFFPHLIRDIARLLLPHGVFIVLTHSKNSLQEVIQFIMNCMEKIGIKHKETAINKLFLAFSRENGDELLKKYFTSIEMTDFKNSIIFPYKNIDDCVFYVNKKRNLMYKEVLDVMPDKLDVVQNCVEDHIIEYARMNSIITLNKDDAVFRCFGSKFVNS